MPRLPKVVIPSLSFVALLFAVVTVVRGQRTEPPHPPVVQPPRTPFSATISGSAVVEPANERATLVGPPVAGMVLAVHVSVGDVVSAGAPLFRLDDRPLVAQRKVQLAARDVAKAKLEMLRAQPRAETVPPLEAQVAQADAVAADWSARVARLEVASSGGESAVSLDQLDQARWSRAAARSALALAGAQLALAKAGAWSFEVAESRAELAQAEALLEQTETEIDRYTVRAPCDGTVLQVNVRAGEYATTGGDSASTPLVVVGDTRTLRVRVVVVEEWAPLVQARTRAFATLRGFPAKPIPLEFVRIEPYVQVKRSLTGANTERVDTRVLQVVYRLGAHELPVYVGQQLDVFIDAEPPREPASADPLR
jgi:VCBS repeat-containing protein